MTNTASTPPGILNINELAEYTIRPAEELDHDEPPYIDLVHSRCNHITYSVRHSTSLVEMMQRALNHTKECER